VGDIAYDGYGNDVLGVKMPLMGVTTEVSFADTAVEATVVRVLPEVGGPDHSVTGKLVTTIVALFVSLVVVVTPVDRISVVELKLIDDDVGIELDTVATDEIVVIVGSDGVDVIGTIETVVTVFTVVDVTEATNEPDIEDRTEDVVLAS
jgi:hypothetical protein